MPDIRTVMQKNQRQSAQEESIKIGQKRCSGVISIASGESIATITFPVAYSEMPFVSTGGILDEGQVFTAGQWPTISASVKRFITKPLGEVGIAWTGAELMIVFEAGFDLTAYTGKLQWAAVGQALMNPIGV